MNKLSFQEQIARKFPPNYRQEIVPVIMERIKKGESCFIVGVSGTGKSNLFRCLRSPEATEKYLADPQGRHYAFIWADTNALAGELSVFHLYELILYNLQKWAEENIRPEDTPSSLQELYKEENVRLEDTRSFLQRLHKEVVESESQVLAQRHLETALRHLFNQIENFHVVFLFDEFEPIARELNFQFFKNLRWLRDEFKYHLSYIMGAHRMPMAIREEFFDQGEPFYELLASNILGLKPYNPADTQFAIAELSRRYGVELTPAKNELLVRASGGHSGLIVAVFKILLSHAMPRQHEESQVQQLLTYDAVAGECRKIWNSLEVEEQDALLQLTKGEPGLDKPLSSDSLLAKGIMVRTQSEQMGVFSPLFEKFLATLI